MGCVCSMAEHADVRLPCLCCVARRRISDCVMMQLLFQWSAHKSKEEEDVIQRHVYEQEIMWRNKPRLALKKPKELNSVKPEQKSDRSNPLDKEKWFQGSGPEEQGVGVPSMGGQHLALDDFKRDTVGQSTAPM